MEPLQLSPVTLTSDPFTEKLQKLAHLVEDSLRQRLPSSDSRLHEAMRYSVLGGGKRLRSLLVWESSHLFNVPSNLALNVAVALELIQAYSLVHDDLPCMDNADFRRGKPSVHKAYGEATATLVGDALIPLAFQELSSLKTSPDISLSLIQNLSIAIGSQGLVAGQMIDLGEEKPVKTYDDLLHQDHLKTGVLFAFAAESGALLGNASFKEKQALHTYGLLFGRAFQMIDDWLDGCGHEKTMGKPHHQDFDKVTFLSLLGPKTLQEKVELTLQDAIQVLDIFHEKGLPLKETALSLLSHFRTSGR